MSSQAEVNKMKFSTWLLQFEDHLVQSYVNENYAGAFESFCKKLFEVYQASEEI